MAKRKSLGPSLARSAEPLYREIRAVLESARAGACRAVNAAMVQAYWNVGRLIFEHGGWSMRATPATRNLDAASTLKVSHANGKPILFLPPEPERSDLPEGWTDVQIDGQTYSANFVKVAINVVRQPGEEDNDLPRILRGWFGPDAGAPGTRHAVALEQRDVEWHLAPLGQRRGELQLWRAYSREEIPPLFGLKFSTGAWNKGFVKFPGHIFLLATLDKSGHQFQYKDHFASPTEFEWQSQNRTSQASADGRDIQKHAERGVAVHLFVRHQKKLPGGGSAPFVYCGDVEFVEWHGDKPITVRWRLREAVPERLRSTLGVADGRAGL